MKQLLLPPALTPAGEDTDSRPEGPKRAPEDLAGLVGFGSDGASVNLGTVGGILMFHEDQPSASENGQPLLWTQSKCSLSLPDWFCVHSKGCPLSLALGWSSSAGARLVFINVRIPPSSKRHPQGVQLWHVLPELFHQLLVLPPSQCSVCCLSD